MNRRQAKKREKRILYGETLDWNDKCISKVNLGLMSWKTYRLFKKLGKR